MRHNYFAYGSNMQPARMAERCPAATPIGVGWVADRVFRINERGVATLARVRGGTAEGVLWSVTDECLQALDRYEGVSLGLYEQEMITVSTPSGRVRAITYVGGLEAEGDPRPGYLETILEGAFHFGLSESYRARLQRLGEDRQLHRRARFTTPHDLKDTKAGIARLATRVAAGSVGTAQLWSGAKVVISPVALPSHHDGFYPEPIVVVTPVAAQLSWLFAALRDIFSTTRFYDHQSRIELFERLAAAAQRYQATQSHRSDPARLLEVVLDEALVIAADMENGLFYSPSIVFGQRSAGTAPSSRA